MKPLLKTLLFLGILTVLDLVFRNGLIGFFIPFELPLNANILVLFSIFAVLAWWVTQKFAKSDRLSLYEIGIGFGQQNRNAFYTGLLLVEKADLSQGIHILKIS